MGKLKIAVFASGQGTNFQALANRAEAGELDASIELLVCDKPGAPVIGRAEAAGIDVLLFVPKEFPTREAHDRFILKELERRGVELVVLAGYMRIVSEVLVAGYDGRMINIHPALLPSFPGINGIKQALDYGVRVTGVTVHYVDGGMDTGPIIAQKAVEVLPGDDEESLAIRIHEAEQHLLPWVVSEIAAGRVKLEGRHVTISKVHRRE
jgi:phosphoribosylglycinamide formyltransferase 1